MAFRKAVKHESKLRLAIAGPSGAGKTFTALRLAHGLGGSVAVLDTEHGAASKYADLFEFDTDPMEPPFHPRRYMDAIKDAVSGGYGVLILDSISHAWMGQGGLLEEVDKVAARMRTHNTFSAWKDITPIHQAFIESILQAPIHIIATMRSKQEYVLETNSKGRQAPKKVGMAPIQRDGMEYEFDVVMEMDLSNRGVVTKTRCPALTGGVFDKPGEDVAAVLVDWLQGAPVPEAKQRAATVEAAAAPAVPAQSASRKASTPRPQNGNGHANGKSLAERKAALDQTMQSMGLTLEDAEALTGGVLVDDWSEDDWSTVRDAVKRVKSAEPEDRPQIIDDIFGPEPGGEEL